MIGAFSVLQYISIFGQLSHIIQTFKRMVRQCHWAMLSITSSNYLSPVGWNGGHSSISTSVLPHQLHSGICTYSLIPRPLPPEEKGLWGRDLRMRLSTCWSKTSSCGRPSLSSQPDHLSPSRVWEMGWLAGLIDYEQPCFQVFTHLEKSFVCIVRFHLLTDLQSFLRS